VDVLLILFVSGTLHGFSAPVSYMRFESKAAPAK
jgi:hypothetical protein